MTSPAPASDRARHLTSSFQHPGRVTNGCAARDTVHQQRFLTVQPRPGTDSGRLCAATGVMTCADRAVRPSRMVHLMQ